MLTVTYTLVMVMVGQTPPFAGKHVTINAVGYKTLKECKDDEKQFLNAISPTVNVYKSTCEKVTSTSTTGN